MILYWEWYWELARWACAEKMTLGVDSLDSGRLGVCRAREG